jgi:hypothetical protein
MANNLLMGFAKYRSPKQEERILDIEGPREMMKRTRGAQQPNHNYLALVLGGYAAKGQDREYQNLIWQRWDSTLTSNFQCPKE